MLFFDLLSFYVFQVWHVFCIIQVYAPLVWWFFAGQFHGCFGRAFSSVVHQNKEGEDFVASIDAVGPMNEAIYRQVQKARQKKALAWLLHPSTPRSLGICCSLYRISLPLMGILFKCSNVTKGAAPPFTIVDFVGAQTSPVEMLMRVFRVHMEDMDSVMWRLIKPWSDGNLHDTACAAWTFLGEVYMRSIMVPPTWYISVCMLSIVITSCYITWIL